MGNVNDDVNMDHFIPVSIRIRANVRVSTTVHLFHPEKYILRLQRIVLVSAFDHAVDEAIVQDRIWSDIVKSFDSTNYLFRASHCIRIARFCQSIDLSWTNNKRTGLGQLFSSAEDTDDRSLTTDAKL
jgi:hypothetical protein